MMRFFFLLLAVTMIIFPLSGCTKPPDDSPSGGVVMQITIDHYPEDGTPYRLYTDPSKIETVLKFINALQLDEPEDTEPECTGTQWQIRCEYGDKQSKCYYLLAGKYFREGTNPWKPVADDYPMDFGAILSRNKSDPQEDIQISANHTEICTEKYKIPPK